MKVINVRNVNDAVYYGIELIHEQGVPLPSRVGDTLEVPAPVTTVYNRPWERVLFGKLRDANPFFHFFESLWILAGRDDVAFLNDFNSQMKNYSDDGVIFNAPYGYRMRHEFGVDQITKVAEILKADPMSRQAVIQIWSTGDLGKDTKDKACNMQAVFRVRPIEGKNRLCLTIYNRSNDMIWGAYGANVVQFSMLLEYMAAKVGIPMGTYTQVSNSFHVYVTGKGGEKWNELKDHYQVDTFYGSTSPRLVTMAHGEIHAIEQDMAVMFSEYDEGGMERLVNMDAHYSSDYFQSLVLPMLETFAAHKKCGALVALDTIDAIVAEDWRETCKTWLQKRVK